MPPTKSPPTKSPPTKARRVKAKGTRRSKRNGKDQPYKPEPVTVGNIVARYLRGPHTADEPLPERERRWYWRAFRGDEALGILGWLPPNEVARAVAEKWTISGDATETTGATLAGTVGALCDAFEAYTEARKDAAPNYKKGTRQNLGHIRKGLGSVRVGGLNEDHLIEYQNARLSSGAASVTVADEIHALGRAWKWGGRPGRALAPRIGFPTPRLNVTPTRDKYTPPDADIEATIEAMPAGAWARIWLRVAFRTGMRAHEIAKLQVRDVDLSAAAISVPYAPDDDGREDRRTKTGRRTVKIDHALVDTLAGWIRERGLAASDWLLGVEPSNINAKVGGFKSGAIGRACAKAGIRSFTPHAVRRAVVRRFRRAGVPVGVAAAYFGHSVVVMLKVYDEVDETDHEDALALVLAHEEKVAKNKAAAKGGGRLSTVTPAVDASGRQTA